MSSSIMNKNVSIYMQETETSLQLTMNPGEKISLDRSLTPEQTSLDYLRTVLQNPEISRVQLINMLRRAADKAGSQKQQQTYWNAFMSSYVTQNANSNVA